MGINDTDSYVNYMNIFARYIQGIEAVVQRQRISGNTHIERGDDRLLSPEEVAKLPQWDSYNIPGIGEELKLFQKDGKVVTSQYKDKFGWSQPKEAIESNYVGSVDLFLDMMKKTTKYERVFPLSVEQKGDVLIGFDYEEDPMIVALRVIDEYNLENPPDDPHMHLEGITGMIMRKQREIKGRIVPKQRGVEDKFTATFVLICILLGMYVLYSLLLPPQRKKGRKQ